MNDFTWWFDWFLMSLPVWIPFEVSQLPHEPNTWFKGPPEIKYSEIRSHGVFLQPRPFDGTIESSLKMCGIEKHKGSIGRFPHFHLGILKWQRSTYIFVFTWAICSAPHRSWQISKDPRAMFGPQLYLDALNIWRGTGVSLIARQQYEYIYI